MKKTMMTITCLLAMVACFTACKKNRPAEPENLLVGDWREIEPGGQYLSLKFDKNHAFWFSTIVSGTSMKYSGTYKLTGNDLKATATEMSIQEQGKPVQTTVVNDELFPEATYTVRNDTLTLSYQAHTAAWPVVPTTIKLRKMITID